MSFFEFKIVGHKAKEEKDYKVSYVKKSQKPKVCGICGHMIMIGESSTTFMKMLKMHNEHKKFMTQHTCGGKAHDCTKKMAKQLNVTLP